MVSKIGGIESDPLSLKSINFEKINEKRLKPYEDRVKVIEDKIDFTTEKSKAFGVLRKKLDTLKSSIENISLQANAKVACVVRSTEIASKGSSADYYFDVSASSGVYIGDIDIRVQQLATKASVSLQRNGNIGFAIGEQFKNNALSIEIVGVDSTKEPVIVDNLYNLTVNQVVDNINRRLNTSQMKATAALTPTAGGLYNIKITSSVMGDRTIKLQPKTLNYLMFPEEDDDTLYDTVIDPNSKGLDAIVIINNQQEVKSDNNTIKLGKDANGLDIPNHIAQGITLTLKKKNSTLNPLPLGTLQPYQTISIEQDTDIIIDKISEFVDAYNDVNEFITTQQKRKISGIGYEDDAYLARTYELRMVQDLLFSISNYRVKGGLSQKITSLASMGVLYKQDVNMLDIKSERLKELLNTDFDEVMKFFNHADTGIIPTFTIHAEGERKEGEKRLPFFQEIIRLVGEAAKDVNEKLLKEHQEFEKADEVLRKERNKIEEEMYQIDFINTQAAMMQMYFQAMMQA